MSDDEVAAATVRRMTGDSVAAVAAIAAEHFIGPGGALAGALLAAPAGTILERLDKRAADQIRAVVAVGGDTAGLTPEGVAEWAELKPARGQLLLAAIDAAQQARALQVLDGLASVLGDAIQDDARLDTSEIYVDALKDLRTPHIKVLEHFADSFDGEHTQEWSSSELWDYFPPLAEGMDYLLAALDARGFIRLGLPRLDVPSSWRATAFGKYAMDYLKSCAISRYDLRNARQ